MQIIAKQKTGDTNIHGHEIYVQQIVVSGANDGKLSDACDGAFELLRSYGVHVQFRDDEITDEVRTRILQGIATV